MNTINIRRAADLTDNYPVEPVTINIHQPFKDNEYGVELQKWNEAYEDEAKRLFDALLNALPQATLDRLMARLLTHRANNCYFRYTEAEYMNVPEPPPPPPTWDDKPETVESAPTNPMQPVYVDDSGRWRFKENKIVDYLLTAGNIDLNQLALIPGFSQDDWEQFYQLIGYSVSGFGGLSRVSDETAARAGNAVEAKVIK